MGSVELILIGMIAALMSGLVLYYVAAGEAARKRRMMGVIHGGVGAVVNDKDAGHQRRADISRQLKEERASARKKSTLGDMIGQAGLEITPLKFWVFSVVLGAVCTLLAKMMGLSDFVVLMAAVTGVFGLPKLTLKKMAARRQKAFLEEFPDALEAVVRLLKAGMPVAEAVSMISKEFTGPVGEEMTRVYERQKIGVPLHEAALEATRRMPLTEMQMFATGLAIQAQTGSSLSEVLMNLSGVIRARFRLKRKVKALSSEAIASAGIIGALPILVAGGMYLTNEEYISVLFTDSFGKVLLIGAVMWMGMGVMMMKIMINFKV